MERLKMMKEQLMSSVQGELGNLSQANAEELGSAIDMIKDLSEAIYYCTIVKSMEDSEKESKEKYYPMHEYRDMDRNYGRMYYDGGTRGYQPRDSKGRFTDYAMEDPHYYTEYRYDGDRYRNYPIELRDRKEGQSPLTRKTYMERKMHGGDKAMQMQELEKYMHELTNDLMEMVEGSSPEEKQMLQKKLSTLATKIV